MYLHQWVRSAIGKYGCVFFIALLIHCGGKTETPAIDDPHDPGVVTIEPESGNDLYGLILDDGGQPVQGVVVSDGYTCVQTDEEGVYQLKRNANARFVFYVTPADYAINVETSSRNIPSFYKPINAAAGAAVRADFQLTKLPRKESDFTLFCIGDPQVTNQGEVTRFQQETINDLKMTLSTLSTPAYGLSMGDVVGDQQGLLNSMKNILGSTSMPVFTTIGNHDKFSSAPAPRTGDFFSNIYGPLNYSFNRGDVHFICLDNVVFTDHTNYTGAFSEEQLTWLEQDLSYVPKDKMIILYYHIPIRGANMANKDKLLKLFEGYAEVHFMSGHTHYNQNYIHTSVSPHIYEHIHGAACGAWWRSTINGDGTPNGYAVYRVTGNTITEWYYKATNYDKDFQIRLHWGDASFGGQYGYFSYSLPGNTLVANVWNADDEWVIEVYEDGVKTGNMAPAAVNRDAWSLGYHIGVLNRNPANYSQLCTHLYTYAPENPRADIKVLATDRFGNVYEQHQLTTDFNAARSY
ncbi:Calcineurin-like phosphoesterase [Parapedobacter composti]|uniref:Calcineurin-like phosphoesterase n=1 Tax=Parapedobacter composti TaxID=623281 RepID=A0A1I1F2X4_9SPHI|nr:calcineurin-like phosphoesterase family protein [Parapedobacter composti]SFB93684.1 Calcineurin-like phosphoesterase [Parapedobacter composti]